MPDLELLPRCPPAPPAAGPAARQSSASEGGNFRPQFQLFPCFRCLFVSCCFCCVVVLLAAKAGNDQGRHALWKCMGGPLQQNCSVLTCTSWA